MARSPSPSQALLSFLVGPGPRGGGSTSTLRVGISNLDECAHALRLCLSLLPEGAAPRPLAQAEWGGLLARRSQRELAIALDWQRRELKIEGRASPFAAKLESAARGSLVLRAELFDGRGNAPDVLEVGLPRAVAGAGRP